jgi:hypothetical protein
VREDAEPEEEDFVQRFAQTSLGSMFAASVLGLGEVLEPSKRKHEFAIVQDWAGEPLDDDIVLDLDPDDPSRSTVVLRHRPEDPTG